MDLYMEDKDQRGFSRNVRLEIHLLPQQPARGLETKFNFSVFVNILFCFK